MNKKKDTEEKSLLETALEDLSKIEWDDEHWEENLLPARLRKKHRKKVRNAVLKRAKENTPPPESLIGKCLVHIGEPSKEIYRKAVIYITDCTPQMVRGIIINKLLLGSAVLECKTGDAEKGSAYLDIYEDLYQGGPESPAHGFVLFPLEEYLSDIDPFAEIQGEIAVSSSFGILQEILDGIGPERKIIAMGHCLWKRGELEWEIFNNQWLIVPATPKLIFDTSFEERWEKAKEASGLNMSTYIPQIGLA